MQHSFGDFIKVVEAGHLTLIEANELGDVHKQFHELMVEAFKQDIRVVVIDNANHFNPQLLSSIAFEHGLNSHEVLNNVQLSRPFQIYQALSVVQQLVKVIEDYPGPQLLIVTDIITYFFDAALANEDPDFPVPQLQMLAETIGILKSLAMRKELFLVVSAKNTETVSIFRGTKDVTSASLQYQAKTHVKIEYAETYNDIELVKHPFLPQLKKRVKVLSKKEIKEMEKVQYLAEIDEFFDDGKYETRQSKQSSCVIKSKKRKKMTVDQYF